LNLCAAWGELNHGVASLKDAVADGVKRNEVEQRFAPDARRNVQQARTGIYDRVFLVSILVDSKESPDDSMLGMQTDPSFGKAVTKLIRCWLKLL